MRNRERERRAQRKRREQEIRLQMFVLAVGAALLLFLVIVGIGRWREAVAERKLLHMLPEELQTVYAPVLTGQGGEVEKLVKAADKLSAYIKCVEELKAGNNEFREAAAQTRKALEDYELPEVSYFMDTFLDSFSLTLDELK